MIALLIVGVVMVVIAVVMYVLCAFSGAIDDRSGMQERRER